MRLLNSRTLKLHEFFENTAPAYATLSHTWEEEEVTYEDMQGLNSKKRVGLGLEEKVRKMVGYIKIQSCCDQAARDGFDYVWIDTCCIDKSSSAELSEAINSMYHWYKNSKICYAYLADVSPNASFSVSAPSSRWFTRGWTLQELIAPAFLRFYAQDWTVIGSKEDLSDVLSQITGIDEATLRGRDVKEISVARRMSWASKRVTTRTEDIAYCLIGIFGVNLPLLYGEGERAFIRLQEEIMKSSDDQSLFAWEDRSTAQDLLHEPGLSICFSSEDNPKTQVILGRASLSARPRPLRGFLARSPAEFENSGNVIPYRNWDISMPYSMTNQGLQIQLSVFQHDGYDEYVGILACHFEDNFLGPLGICIQPIASSRGDQFARDVSYTTPVIVVPEHVSKAVVRTLYIRQDVLLPSARDFDRKHHFLIRTVPDDAYILSHWYPLEHWNESQRIIRSPNRIGALFFQYRDWKWVDEPKPLSFAVLVRSDIAQEGADYAQPSFSCNIIVDPPVSDSTSLAQLVENTPAGTLQSTSEDLTIWDSRNKETAVAKISREVFLGQEMFVVDIAVLSTSMVKRVPSFFTTQWEGNRNQTGRKRKHSE